MLCFPPVAKERAYTITFGQDYIYKIFGNPETGLHNPSRVFWVYPCQFDMSIIKVQLYLIILQYSSHSIKQALMLMGPSHAHCFI